MADWSMSGAPEFKDVRTLIAGVKRGELALPEFQRDFVWKPRQVTDLLTSIARGWPAGTFLLLSGEQVEVFAAKALDRAPDLDDLPDTLVLDGQQRLTALYHAFEDQSDDVYYCKMFALQDSGELDDDHILYQRRSRFFKQYADLEAQAASGIIPIYRIVDDELFQEWINHLPEERKGGMFRLREVLLPGLRSYQMPSVMLTGDVPLAAVAKIFETINRTGIRLATFDLMVARLYPHGFKLRDKWNAACDDYPLTLDAFDTISGIDVLKLIALWEHLRQKAEDVSPRTVKGVRESDVLLLEPQVVIECWDRAVAALDRAIEFVSCRCGAIRPALVPSHSMLIPLADALRSGAPSEGWTSRLLRWFWCTALNQTYSQGANTQAVADAQSLRAWKESASATPSVVEGGLPKRESLEETMRDSRRRNEMIVRAILCAVIDGDGKDWVRSQRRLKDIDEPLDVHHVFSREFVKQRGWGDPNIVANFTPLTQSTNKKIRSDAPSSVVARSDVAQSVFGGHYIDYAAYAADDWNAFLTARIDALMSAFSERV